MTGRASGGPLLEADLCGSSRACETREGREAEIREKVERWFEVEKVYYRIRWETYGGPGMGDGMEQWGHLAYW